MPLLHFDDHVADAYLYVTPYLMAKDRIHESLIGGTSFLEAEWHDIIVGITMIRHKISLWCIQRIHLYLIVVRVGFDEA